MFNFGESAFLLCDSPVVIGGDEERGGEKVGKETKESDEHETKGLRQEFQRA